MFIEIALTFGDVHRECINIWRCTQRMHEHLEMLTETALTFGDVHRECINIWRCSRECIYISPTSLILMFN
jgi:hypothetical protein